MTHEAIVNADLDPFDRLFEDSAWWELPLWCLMLTAALCFALPAWCVRAYRMGKR